MDLERYREIVPDWQRFVETVSRPEPVTLRARTGRIEPEDLADRLRGRGFRVVPVPEAPGFLRVEDGPRPVAHTVEHWLGLFYIQRVATGLAAPGLDPRPGERVLDLCAAPGGKTTHMADLMEDRGPLVAVDVSEGRLRALGGNLSRTAHTNVVAIAASGRSLPLDASFDRVLVDAPCSAEGTLRDRGGRLRPRSASFARYAVQLQRDLLRRAIRLTRPGGLVLYSTCTFHPEENEGVVDAVLRDLPVEVEPIPLDVPHAPGVVAWAGRRYDPRVMGAVRLYPHHLDSGGLFMARLRVGQGADRTEDGAGRSAAPRRSGEAWSPVPLVFPGDGTPRATAGRRLDAALAFLADAFGVDPALLRARGWTLRGDALWMHDCGEWPVEGWRSRGDWRVLSVGLRAFGLEGQGPPRPSNDLLRWLGTAVRARVVEPDEAGWRRLLAREPEGAPGVPDGYVALRLDGRTAGRGFVRGARLRSEVPRVHARALRRVLDLRAGA